MAIRSNAKTTRNSLGLTGYDLKLIAVISMFIDHAAGTILLRILKYTNWIPSDARSAWVFFYYFLRAIGRMAFPVYCFLLVEGFIHTRSKMRYAVNLFLFALLSEIPFDMAFKESLWDMSYQNVYWELLLGLLMLCAVDLINKKLGSAENPGRQLLCRGCCILTAIAFAGMALHVFNCDYGAAGILAIFAIYAWYENRMVGFTLALLMLILVSSYLELPAVLMLIPIMKYNGKRGKNSPFMKYFFYVFYPLHLFLLSLACYGLGLGI